MEILHHCLCIMMSEQVFPFELHHVAPKNVEMVEVTSLRDPFDITNEAL